MVCLLQKMSFEIYFWNCLYWFLLYALKMMLRWVFDVSSCAFYVSDFNLFQANVSFQYTLKTSENLSLSDVFRKYWNGALVWNGLRSYIDMRAPLLLWLHVVSCRGSKSRHHYYMFGNIIKCLQNSPYPQISLVISNTKKYMQSDWLRAVQYWPYLYSVFNICTLWLNKKTKNTTFDFRSGKIEMYLLKTN